jgi:hypothetical protein
MKTTSTEEIKNPGAPFRSVVVIVGSEKVSLVLRPHPGEEESIFVVPVPIETRAGEVWRTGREVLAIALEEGLVDSHTRTSVLDLALMKRRELKPYAKKARDASFPGTFRAALVAFLNRRKRSAGTGDNATC